MVNKNLHVIGRPTSAVIFRYFRKKFHISKNFHGPILVLFVKMRKWLFCD